MFETSLGFSAQGRPTEMTPAESATDAPRADQEPEGPGEAFVSRWWITFMTVAVTLLAGLALYSLWAFWPITEKPGVSGSQGAVQRLNYFGWRPSLSHEFLFFVVVALAGALGGLVHSIRSFAWYVGNRDLHWSWIPFNLLLPVVGALGGTIFYLVLRAGLFSPSASTDQTSPFGFAAVAVLVGLFSEQALEKLKQVASNLFAERPKGEDHVAPKESSDAERSGAEKADSNT